MRRRRGEGGRGWRNTRCAIAAAVEGVFKADLRRVDADPGLLDGGDEGGEGWRGGGAALRSEVLPEGNPARAERATDQHAQEDEPQQDRHEDRVPLGVVRAARSRDFGPRLRTDEVSQMVRGTLAG